MPKPKIPNQRKAQLEHKKRIERYVALINQLYDKLNKEASKLALATDHDPAKQFLWSDYPQTKAALEKLQSQFISEMQAIIMAGTSAEWKESNLVQDLIAKKLLKAYTGSTKSGEEYTRYFETNPASLQAFQQRRAAGMNLSTRVWNLSEQYKTELEMAVSAAIEPGTSAMELAAGIKKYLNEPDMMFRRFRYKDENGEWKRKWKQKIMGGDGKVHFIDADPKEYHPGRGVYRSSARNAQRLARTEINMAYRTAEQERWRQFDFVVGYEVKTTQNGRHVEDICDCLAGKYRKDFKFLGWHPQCYPIGTEVLTNAGWKQFKDVSDDDLIMSLNPETRALEYVSIADRQCYDFNGDLVRFFNKSLDCAVTPEHRMPYISAQSGQISYLTAKEYDCSFGGFINGETQFLKELTPYSGKVYDLTLERNHIMYVRRNGRCFWGSNCMCYSIPILKTEDEFFDEEGAPSVNEVEDVPQGFKDWIRDNEERIERAEKCGTLPYFIRDNKGEVDRILHPDKEAENAAQSQIKKSAETVVNPKPEPQKPTAQEKNHQELAKALGVEQGEPMSFEKANEMRGNPNYKKGVKYRVNCQCSVLANEMRRRGFDVEAYGNTKQDWYMPSVLAKKPEIAFFDANGNPPAAIGIKFNGDLLTSLQGEMKEPGRYHLRFRFQNDGGHVITAERLADGSLRIYDPQSGKIIKNFSEYTSKVKGDSFEYYRVDNLQINPDVAKGSVKLAKSKGDAPRMQLPEIKDFLEKGWYGEIKADIADYIKKRNIATTNREKVKLDIEMVKSGEFVRSDKYSTAKGSIFSTEKLPDKINKSDKELSKNMQMAKKMANNGYDVYLLSNPQATKSADFIFVKDGKAYYTEGKLSTGKNSLDHNLAKGGRQSERILVDLTNTADTNYISSQLEKAFQGNDELKEVMLLKGGRLIPVNEMMVSRKDFRRYFKKIWEQKK